MHPQSSPPCLLPACLTAKTRERHASPSLIGVGVGIGIGIGISQCWYHDSIFPYHADHICQHAQLSIIYQHVVSIQRGLDRYESLTYASQSCRPPTMKPLQHFNSSQPISSIIMSNLDVKSDIQPAVATSYSQVACIGAGFSAIGVGSSLKRWYGITDITFFERRESSGGTWLANNYPG